MNNNMSFRGVKITPKVTATVDIARYDSKLTICIDCGNGAIVAIEKDEKTSKAKMSHVCDGFVFEKGTPSKALMAALKPYEKQYNEYRTAAIKSAHLTRKFGGKLSREETELLRTEEVV